MADAEVGTRLTGTREPAWRAVGEAFKDEHNATEAIERAGIGYEIEKHQLATTLPNGRIVKSNKWAVMRSDQHDNLNPTILGITGKNWTPIQQKQLGQMLDPISREFPVETAGETGDGRRIFLSLKAGSAKIAREDHDLYFLVTDNRDGNGGLTVAFTPVRVFCQNVLIYALSSAKVSVTLQHDSAIVDDADWYINLLGKMGTARDDVITSMNALSRGQIDDTQAKEVIRKSYRKPSMERKLQVTQDVTADDVPAEEWARVMKEKAQWDKNFEVKRQRIEAHKDLAFEAYDIFNQQHPDNARTPWAVYHAVVAVEDYRRGPKGRKASAIYGERADTKERAFREAYQLAEQVG